MNQNSIELFFWLWLLMMCLTNMWSDTKKVQHVCTCNPLPPIAPMVVMVSNQYHEEKRRYTGIIELIHKVFETYQMRQGHSHPIASAQDQARIRELLSEFAELRWVVMSDPLYSEMLHSHYVGLMKTLLAERKAPRLTS